MQKTSTLNLYTGKMAFALNCAVCKLEVQQFFSINIYPEKTEKNDCGISICSKVRQPTTTRMDCDALDH